MENPSIHLFILSSVRPYNHHSILLSNPPSNLHESVYAGVRQERLLLTFHLCFSKQNVCLDIRHDWNWHAQTGSRKPTSAELDLDGDLHWKVALAQCRWLNDRKSRYRSVQPDRLRMESSAGSAEMRSITYSWAGAPPSPPLLEKSFKKTGHGVLWQP